MEDLDQVASVSSWESGGGITLDLVYLKDGSVLAISGDSIVLYSSEEDLMDGDAAERPMIVRLAEKV